MKKQILREALWYILAGITSFIIGQFLFGHFLSYSALDIHLHNTYFVVDKVYLMTLIFIFVLFLIYAVRTFIAKFSIPFANWTMLLSGLVSVIALTFFIMIIFQLSYAGTTLYPPLSQLGPDKFSKLKPSLLFNFAAIFLILLEIFLFVGLVFLIFKWRRRKMESA